MPDRIRHDRQVTERRGGEDFASLDLGENVLGQTEILHQAPARRFETRGPDALCRLGRNSYSKGRYGDVATRTMPKASPLSDCWYGAMGLKKPCGARGREAICG